MKNLGPLNAYVDLIQNSGIARIVGFGTKLGSEHASFILNNDKGFELITNPEGIKLKNGEIMILLNHIATRTRRDLIVSTPSEALRLIIEWNETV